MIWPDSSERYPVRTENLYGYTDKETRLVIMEGFHKQMGDILKQVQMITTILDKLHTANQECQQVTKASAKKEIKVQMEEDIEEVKKIYLKAKRDLEELDKDNIVNRKKAYSGEGSIIDYSRIEKTMFLKKKLKKAMSQFQMLWQIIQNENRETVERKVYAVIFLQDTTRHKTKFSMVKIYRLAKRVKKIIIHLLTGARPTEEVSLPWHEQDKGQVNKSAKTFQKKGCLINESLCQIYGDTTTMGNLQHPSTKIPSDTEGEESEESRSKSLDGSIFKEKHEDVAFKGKLHLKCTKKKNILDVIACSLHVLSESSKKNVDMMEKRMSMSSEASSGSSESILIECMNYLNLIEDLDDISYSKALQKFQEDSIWMKIFLHMPECRRKGWILTLK